MFLTTDSTVCFIPHFQNSYGAIPFSLTGLESTSTKNFSSFVLISPRVVDGQNVLKKSLNF